MSASTRGLLEFAESLVELRRSGRAPRRPEVALPPPSSGLPAVSSARHAIEEGGPAGYARWLRSSPRLLLADVSLERLQSSALGGRVRTAELRRLAAEAVRLLPELSSLEVLAARSFGRALGEAKESPVRRIEEIRRVAPGLVLRASVSAATALGRGVAGSGTLKLVARELASAGVDVIRIADPFNDADRLAAAVHAMLTAGVVVEGAVCISGAVHPRRSAGHVEAAVAVAATLERHGVTAVVLDDRFGVLRPVAAYSVVRGIRREVGVPVWVRFVEANGYGLASTLSAVEAGAVGADTVLPCLAGTGHEASAVALASALEGTERQPEADPVRLTELDRHLSALTTLLGGRATVPVPPPDAADRGVPPDLLAEVLGRAGGPEAGGGPAAPAPVSADHALAACEAAWQALGEPAPVAPAREALVELAAELVRGKDPAGRVLDRARADDPQGLLDSVASLREGGFPDLEPPEPQPTDARSLLAALWPEAARQYAEHVGRYGEIELVPADACLFGLAPGDSVDVLLEGLPRRLHVVEREAGSSEVTIELDGEPEG